MKLFDFVAKNCINCYKCVRNCHVKAMRVNQGKIEIDEEKCIACGQCFVVCPKNAHNTENDVELVSDTLKLPGKKIAVIDSAYLGIYEDPGQFISALKKLGFDSVQEIAAGAEAIKDEYIQYISMHPDKKYIISSTCPSVYMFIMKYYPSIAQYLIPVVTPVLALGKAIEMENPEGFIVYIGPCLSKKYETVKMNEHSPLHALLTFDEIQRLLLWNHIKIEQMTPCQPDRIAHTYGEKYSIAGDSWISLKAVLDEKGYDFFHVSGLDSIRTLFELIKNNELEKSYIGISSCRESCAMGPFIPKKAKNIFSRKQKMKNFAAHGWNLEDITLPQVNWSNVDLRRNFYPMPVVRKKASEKEIQAILMKMDKFSRRDELDCGACGYESCRDKAQAVYEGMAEIEMCLPFMRSRAENMSDVIFLNSRNMILLIDEDLNMVQINPVAEKIMGIHTSEASGRPVNTVMDDAVFREAFKIQKDIMNVKVELPRYGIIVMENVVYIKKQKLLFVSLQNVTEDEKRREELDQLKRSTVETAKNVIEKQMRVAQEIASLLGETTAETKVALNRLRDVVIKEGD